MLPARDSACCINGLPVFRTEDILEVLAPQLDAYEPASDIVAGVTDHVVSRFAFECDEHVAPFRHRSQPGRKQFFLERDRIAIDFDKQRAGGCREIEDRPGAHEVAGINHNQVIADTFDLAEQVAGHDYRDAKFGTSALYEFQHFVAPGGVE